MKISLTMDFSDSAEASNMLAVLAQTFRGFAARLKDAVDDVLTDPPTVAGEPAGDAASASAESGKRRPGRPSKPKTDAAAPSQPVQTTEGTALPDDHLITELRETGNTVLQKTGPEDVMEVLKKYNAKKYGEVAPASRQALLDDLKAKLA
jgi:hypothetical protein